MTPHDDPWATVPPDDATLAQTLPRCGRYQVTATLGEGSFGIVYRGYDPVLGRDVAIKVPRPQRMGSPADVEAYLAEARTLAGLDHPAIVPVFDAERTDDGRCYVVSKFMPKGDLARAIAQRRPGHGEAAELVARIADGLDHAHQRGLVHRDIKPANILLDEAGSPLVADFGLALSDEGYGEGSGYCGTPVYMSPEQARGEGHRVDARSDIYSLGVVFYELLTGRRPYRHGKSPELLDEITSGEIRSPRQFDPTIPLELERICLKALARRAEDRYTTAFDLASDLRQAQVSGASGGRKPPVVLVGSGGAVGIGGATGIGGRDDTVGPGGEIGSRRSEVGGRKSPWPQWPWRWLAAGAAIVLCVAGLALFAVLGPRGGDIEQVAVDPKSAAAPLAPSAPLRVLSLEIEGFSNHDNQFDQPRGVLGKKSFGARLDDSVTVQARLSRPAYAYLIAFRPDGTDQVCFPEHENEAPPLDDRPRYPSVSRGVNYGLNEGTGLWVFAVLASDEPLPPYRQWRAQCGSPPWQREDCPPDLVLWDDGQWLESFTPGGPSRGARGKGVSAGKAPTAVVRLTDWLKQSAGTSTAAARGFGVESKK